MVCALNCTVKVKNTAVTHLSECNGVMDPCVVVQEFALVPTAHHHLPVTAQRNEGTSVSVDRW